MSVGLTRGDVILDALPHALHISDEVRSVSRRPHEGRDGIDVRLSQSAVTCCGPRLEKRLELPCLGPALVVAHVGGERAHERPLLALGPQRGVHLPKGPFCSRLATCAQHSRGKPLGRAECCLLVAPVDGLGHEDHVNVAHVVEFAPTALAHRDDSQATWRGVGGQIGTRDREARLQRGIGEVSQLLRDVVDTCTVDKIAHHSGEQFVAIRHAKRIRCALDARSGVLRLRIRAHGAQQSHAALGGAGGAWRDPAQALHGLGMPDEVVGEGIRHADGRHDGGEPVLIRTHLRDVDAGEREPMQGKQCRVRVRRGRERIGEDLGPGHTHFAEDSRGLPGIGEAATREVGRQAGRSLLAHRWSIAKVGGP